jgi:hypothetical protein
MSQMFQHTANASHSLYCKKTRKIVKKFKQVNGMVADSIVDSEAWAKIMQRAIDLLPARINEQASANSTLVPENKEIEKFSPEKRVFVTLVTFNREFQFHSRVPVHVKKGSSAHPKEEYDTISSTSQSHIQTSSTPNFQKPADNKNVHVEDF